MTALDIDFPKAFFPLFDPKRYKVFYGGRGGGKSWAFALALLTIGLNRPIRVLCARELQVSIQDSVHKLLSDIINKYPGMAAFYEVQNKAIFGLNGTEFNFKGLKHNANEIKSYEGVDYVWVEEAQAVSNKSWEVLIPTVRKEGSEIWCSFNPKNATDPTWQRFVMNADEDSIVRKVGPEDNPFFPDVLRKEMERLYKTDPIAAAHIWGGEFDTRFSGAVYAKFVKPERISSMVKHDPEFPVYTAWDKGYGDATAITFYQIGNGEVFVIDYFEDNQEDTKYYCEVLAGREIEVLGRDMQTGEVTDWQYGPDIEKHKHRRAYRYDRHFVPHDAAAKLMEAGGRSMMMQAARFGVKMFMIPATSQMNNEEAVRMTLPKCWINKDNCGDLIQALMTYHYEYDEDRQRYSKLPYHDWSSNACDSFEIMARTWQTAAVSVQELDRRALVSDFHSKRIKYGLQAEDPYQINRSRKVRDKR